MNTTYVSSGRSPRALISGFAGLWFASAALLATAQTASAQNAGALVDALVRKGVLTNKEAEDVRADLSRDLSQTSAGKIKLSDSVSELKLYGDFRLRYQYENREAQLPDTGHNFQQSRYRFRLRLNAEAKLGSEWFAGFSLGTAQASDGEDQTYENGFDDYNIFIIRAYLGWQNDWLTVIAGKQKNPFYTTDLLWDADITPTGVTETIALHNLPIFGGSGGPAGDSKDINPVTAPAKVNPWEVTLVAGQFIFDDNSEFSLDHDLSTDAFLFVEQLITRYKFNKDVSVTIAPAFMSYTAADLSGLTNTAGFTDAGVVGPTSSSRTTTSTVLTTVDTVSANGLTTARVVTPTTVSSTTTTITNPDGSTTATTGSTTVRPGAPTTTTLAVGGPPNRVTTTANTVANATAATPATPTGNALPAVSGETRQMHILTAPGEIAFKLGGIKTKLYWDFAYNFGGRERFEDIYQLYNRSTGNYRYSERDGTAWLAGIQFNELKKKGDWSINANYREVGLASVDPNLNDSTWALGRVNQRGFKLGLGYQIADPVVLTATGFFSWNLNGDVVGGRATNAPNIADSNAVQVFLLELNVKF